MERAFNLILLLFCLTSSPISLAEIGVEFQPQRLLAAEPIQKNISVARPFSFSDYQITPLARYSAQGRVLGLRNYGNDREAELATLDMVLGWGLMASPAFLQKVKIDQAKRNYFWWTEDDSLVADQVNHQSANLHLIPATEQVRKALAQLRVDQRVMISGTLVKVQGKDNWRWISSLSRTDKGAGACELIFVQRVSVIR